MENKLVAAKVQGWGCGEVGLAMKLSEGRMWKQKASQQKDVSATYQCLQVLTIPKSSHDI